MIRFAARFRNWCLAALVLLAALCAAPAGAREDRVQARLDAALAPLEPLSRTGVIHDRVLPFAGLERFDGSPAAPAIGFATWCQAYDELHRASWAPAGPDLFAVKAAARQASRAGVIPLALLDRAYERVREDAFTDGTLSIDGDRLVVNGGDPLVAARAVAATALVPRTFHGGHVTFALDVSRWFSDDPAPRSIAIDFDDGRGERTVRLGEPVRVEYAETGRRTLRVRLARADGSTAQASFFFDVEALGTPLPDDTLHVTASVPYQGNHGTGNAYVYLAPGHAAVVNPIVVVEGFDLDNSMDWDELYQLLNQESLLETLRAEGFDAVVLDFTDATAAIQQNGLVVAELIQQVQAAIAPQATLAVVGASMGGLCSRYALAYLESNAVPHRVRTWISFDAPQAGASIPLGLQHWIRFFSGQSADAAAFLAALDRPASRQMLLYHYTEPPGATGQADPLRASLIADLAAVGDYPSMTRRVAVANGSSARADQGFAPGAQVVRWQYSSALVAVTGDIWAVPDQVSTRVFNGSIRILFSTTSQQVTVSGTEPWDGAPGGSRASFSELDATAAPYGDIVALHPAHCFIPTVSALALDTADPFYDVAGDPDLLAHTPFDAVYVPAVNQGHVLITPENAAWVRSEIELGLVGVPSVAGPVTVPLAASPNPFRSGSRLEFMLGSEARVTLRVFSADGREVRTLVAETRAAGRHAVAWDGRDARGVRAPAGVYFVRFESGGRSSSRRVVKLD